MKVQVDRTNPLPLYVQLKQSILDLIQSNTLQPGSQLPSEEELVAATGTSRYTVRQALEELERDGRVQRIHGKGTFVTEPQVSLSVAYKLLGFTEDMTQKGHTVQSRVLEMHPLPAPDDVAGALGVEPASPVVLLRRLRFVDGRPFLIDIIYVRADLCPGLERVDFTDASLFHVLEANYGLRVVRARRTLRIVTADAWVAEHLGLPVGEPLHLLTDLGYIESGEAVNYAHTLIHDRNSEFAFDLVRAPELEKQMVMLPNSTNPIPRREH